MRRVGPRTVPVGVGRHGVLQHCEGVVGEPAPRQGIDDPAGPLVRQHPGDNLPGHRAALEILLGVHPGDEEKRLVIIRLAGKGAGQGIVTEVVQGFTIGIIDVRNPPHIHRIPLRVDTEGVVDVRRKIKKIGGAGITGKTAPFQFNRNPSSGVLVLIDVRISSDILLDRPVIAGIERAQVVLGHHYKIQLPAPDGLLLPAHVGPADPAPHRIAEDLGIGIRKRVPASIGRRPAVHPLGDRCEHAERKHQKQAETPPETPENTHVKSILQNP